MSSAIKIPEVPGKMSEKFVDNAVPGQEESLYDIPRPTATYCTFLGEAEEEIAESDSPIPVPPNEMLAYPAGKDQDVGVTKLVVQSPQDLQSGVTSFFAQKPVIADVKIIKHEPGGSAAAGKIARFLTTPEGPPKESWSAEAINRLEILSNLRDDDLNFRFKNRTSTFVNPASSHAKQSVYIDLGEYQTLLKHDAVKEEVSEKDSDDGERLYSLSQPQCYSEDTMKAVQTITQRFDSFKLRQLRVRSFREAGGHTRRRTSNASAGRQSSNSVDGSDEEEKENLDRRRGSGQLRERSAAVEEVESAILTERDVYRIEVFYRGQEAEVYVCRCIADVFMGASTKPNEETYHWVQTHTGVPVLLLNTGSGVKPRELVLLVAQRDTALPLWQDKINYLSGYHESSPGVHMMKVSGSLSKAIQLRMIDEVAAKGFLDRFSEITSDPDDELWKISGAEQNQVKDGRRHKKLKSQVSKGRRKRHVTKADISQPCNSTQLTKVDAKDHNFRAAFGDLLPALKLLVNSGDPSGIQDEDFRPRLPTR